MRVSITRTRDQVRAEFAKLRAILTDMPATAPSRYALAELVLIRTAAVFERAIAELAYKLACGGTFISGGDDAPQHVCRSLAHARSMMLSAGGTITPPRSYLKWTRSRYIKESVFPVLRDQSHLVVTCANHGQVIKEIFEVRHYAAHKNASSRSKYLHWVAQQYGQPRQVQLGYFLLTENLNPISNISRYISSSVAIIDEVCQG